MVDVPRKGWPDRRPPPPPRRASTGTSIVPCSRCGDPLLADERDDGEPPRHLVCDPAGRRALAQRMEASRAVQRVIAALATVPPIGTRLGAAIADIPDACDLSHALAFLAQARTVVDCTPNLTPQQRRMATSFLDATERKLGA